MRAIIVGCGRAGAGMAQALSEAGHEVTIIDISSNAFRRLPADFSGSAVRGNGTDAEVLRRAGAQDADILFSLTEGDNRNILAAQLASASFGVKRVVAKINDPVRAEAYLSLGLSVICRTTMMLDALSRFVGLPGDAGAMSVIEPKAGPASPGAPLERGGREEAS
jgi:trk system potassium uptake protein